MLKSKISASLMCASLLNLEKTIHVLEKSGVDYLHIDVMDGVFVPNIMLSNSFILEVRKVTKLPLDIHLMISQPENKINWFDIHENDIVSIHYESTSNVLGSLQIIEKLGAKPAVALSPATPKEVLSYLLDNLSMVNVMAVNPGFMGRKMVPMTLQKIKDVREFLDSKGKNDVMIEADGNVTFENAIKMRVAGADMFVGGSSCLFNENIKLNMAVKELRKCIR